MNPLPTLNPTMPVMVPVAVPVAVLVPTPRVARRVQPQLQQPAKPAEARQPTTLETVAKMVDNVAQIAGVVGKFFGKPAVARAARPTQAGRPSDFAQSEMLPDTAFDTDAMGQGGGGDWGGEPTPTMDAPSASGWDWNPMLGFDPNAMMGFDPNAMTGGFDPNAMMGFDPNAGW